ncbi:MAG: GTPase Era [Chitinophagaceae bacterium]
MYQAGFVNLFGQPNAGKSTLLNALVGEKLAITSPKVQTTRHRIIGILEAPGYQVIFSDTPGIIEPAYKLQEKMMKAVKSALEDADIALLMADIRDEVEVNKQIFTRLDLKVPSILLLNKLDLLDKKKAGEVVENYRELGFLKEIIPISALKKLHLEKILETVLRFLPESEPFYPAGTLTDKPIRFFVGEMIREKIFLLFQEEVPYHTTVLITQFEEKNTLTKIVAEIVVQREGQKGIILGEKGTAIKKLGTLARMEIEKFLDRKTFLELHVRVRDKWRNNDNYLKEYGYQG